MPESLVGAVPSNWEVTTLGEVCTRRGGDIQTGPFGSQLHASDYVAVGIPSIMPQNIGDNRIVTSGIARVCDEDIDRLGRYLVRSGDIVYSRRGDVERRALIRHEQDGWLCGTGCLRVRFGNSVNPAFVSYYLAHPAVRAWIVQHSVGATMPNLNTAILSAVPIVLPPLSEQRRIAGILNALDDKIELNRAANRTLESIARTIFTSWFVDFDPVRRNMERAETGLPPEVAGRFPSRLTASPLGPIPEGWSVRCVRDVAAELEAGSRPRGGVAGVDGGVPSIGAESIIGLGEFDYSKTKYVTDEFWANMRRGHVRSRDVLVYKDGGRPGMFEPHVALFGNGFPFEKCCINEHVYRLRVSSQLSQEYMYFWLTSAQAMNEMRERGTGVAIPSLNSQAFRDVPVLVPPAQLVQRYTAAVEPLVAGVLARAAENQGLTHWRDAALPRLMAGQLAADQVSVDVMTTKGREG